MKKTILTIAVAGLLALAPAFAPEAIAPRFSAASEAAVASNHTLTNLRTGEVVSVLELAQDKPLFLNFWASWCPPCVAEMPTIDAMYQSYDDSVNFAAVSVDYSTGDAYAYINGKGSDLAVPFYYGDVEDIAAAYQLEAIPQSFMIAPGGEIVAHHVGGMTPEQLRSFIESAL